MSNETGNYLITVKAFLQAAGFTIGKEDEGVYGVDWYAWREVPAQAEFLPVLVPPRYSDRKQPAIIVQPWKLGDYNTLSKDAEPTFVMSIRGDIPLANWVRFEHYGLEAGFLLDHFEKLEEALIRAWTAAWRNGEFHNVYGEKK